MTESTATEWYYALNGERVGPRSLGEVRSLVASGVLDADALVWTAGMREWARVGDMPIVSPAWESPQESVRAPEVPVHRVEAVRDEPRPQRRLGARLVDVIVYAVCLGLIVGMLAPDLMPRTPAESRDVNPLWNLAFFPVIALIEGVVLHLFGTTPGKALFSMRITTAGGERLSLAQSLSRAVRVWVVGLGMGLPILSLVAPIFSYFRLNARGRTWWDESLDLRVENGRISPLSAMAIAGVLLLFLLALGSAVSTMAAK
jgi:uncharacterized RDD family membrane protein YckC